MNAEVASGDRAQLLFEVLEGGQLGAIRDTGSGYHDAVEAIAGGPEPEGPRSVADRGHPTGDLLRRDTDLHLAHQCLAPRGLARERDTEDLADSAVRAVAADEIARTEPFAIV